MSFKDISYLELWRPFLFSKERNHLYDFGKGSYKEQLSEIILKFGPVVREGVIKTHFLSRALANPLFGGAKPFVAILVDGIMMNNSVKLF